MKKLLKFSVVIMVLTLIGFVAAFAVLGFDEDKLPDIFYASADEDFAEKTQYAGMDGINQIYVKGKSERIVLGVSDNNEFSVKYFESDYKKTEFTVQDGKISLTTSYSKRSWMQHIKIQTRKTDFIEIKLPTDFDGEIDLGTTSGSVTTNVDNVFSSVKLSSTSSDIIANNLRCSGEVVLTTSSDDIKLTNCEFDGRTQLKTSSGGIEVAGSRMADADINTSSDNIKISDSGFANLVMGNKSGSIRLNNVSATDIVAESSSDRIILNGVTANSVVAKTSSGSIESKNSTFGIADFKSSSDNINVDIDCDHITAKTSSGKITIRARGSFTDYKIDVKTSSGNIRIGEIKYGSGVLNDGSPKYIYAHTSSDNIRIYFS